LWHHFGMLKKPCRSGSTDTIKNFSIWTLPQTLT
jgi:hypothetical protein